MEADIRVISVERSACDPKRTLSNGKNMRLNGRPAEDICRSFNRKIVSRFHRDQSS